MLEKKEIASWKLGWNGQNWSHKPTRRKLEDRPKHEDTPLPSSGKGQLISKGLFGVFKSS